MGLWIQRGETGSVSRCPSCRLHRVIQEGKRPRVYPDQETEDTVSMVVYSQENIPEHHSIILIIIVTLYISKTRRRPHALDQPVHRARDHPVTFQYSPLMRPNYPETSNKLTSTVAGLLTVASLPAPFGLHLFPLATPAHHLCHTLVPRVQRRRIRARLSLSNQPMCRTPELLLAQDRRAQTRVEGCYPNRHQSSLQDSRGRWAWVSWRVA